MVPRPRARTPTSATSTGCGRPEGTPSCSHQNPATTRLSSCRAGGSSWTRCPRRPPHRSTGSAKPTGRWCASSPPPTSTPSSPTAGGPRSRSRSPPPTVTPRCTAPCLLRLLLGVPGRRLHLSRPPAHPRSQLLLRRLHRRADQCRGVGGPSSGGAGLLVVVTADARGQPLRSRTSHLTLLRSAGPPWPRRPRGYPPPAGRHPPMDGPGPGRHRRPLRRGRGRLARRVGPARRVRGCGGRLGSPRPAPVPGLLGGKYRGLEEHADYLEASNMARAHKLARPLLLLHRELDDSVHPAQTLAFVDALLRAHRTWSWSAPGEYHDCATHPVTVATPGRFWSATSWAERQAQGTLGRGPGDPGPATDNLGWRPEASGACRCNSGRRALPRRCPPRRRAHRRAMFASSTNARPSPFPAR